ncbi:cytochrome c3 family protein [Pontitalea aquivivens]|uniref:cytochrome c3 family protein n=1 Tax=Pontitalea aquivivens TaxID=3388663 RepID=UPI00397081AB
MCTPIYEQSRARRPVARLLSVLALIAAPILASGTATAQDTATAPPEMIPAARVPFFHDWLGSPHAKADAQAFTNWNEKGEIPEACARCHSTPGFLDYIGADGSPAGSVEKKAQIGTVIGCSACHNETTRAMTAVTFPSGHRIEGLGAEARCMTCHQGRESTLSVNRATAGIGDDMVSTDLAFLNIHYRAAGATLMGSLARGGYEYDGRSYASQRRHAAPFNTCISCHDLHTVKPKSEPCAACHEGVTDRKSLGNIRKSAVDHDGDGDVAEGIASEITALHGRLLDAIRAYGADVAGSPIAYDAHAHPYFFMDQNGNGTVDENEAVMPNKYASWTPRLLRAAYNYQFVAKDPGAYAHNAPYVLQLLHDSIADLSGGTIEGIARP